MKPFTKIAAVIFGITALIHVFRLIFPFQIMIGNTEIPLGGSIVIIIIGIVLSAGLWQETKK